MQAPQTVPLLPQLNRCRSAGRPTWWGASPSKWTSTRSRSKLLTSPSHPSILSILLFLFFLFLLLNLSLLSLPLPPTSSSSSFSSSTLFHCRKAQPAINTDDLAPWFLDKFHDNIFCAGQWVSICLLLISQELDV